jgi:alpha-L-fucosidase 2
LGAGGAQGGGAQGDGGGDSFSATFPKLAAQYQGVFTAPPKQVDTGETTDAPLLGNGDVGVAILGQIDAMTFILSKTEFWSLSGGRVVPMVRMAMSIPGMSGASYSMTESISTGEVTGTFASGQNSIQTKSWVQADDTTNNKLITELTYTGSAPQNVSVSLSPGLSNNNPSSRGSSADVGYIDVAGDGVATVGGLMTRQVRVAVRAIGTAGTAGNATLNFTLAPGQTVSLVASIMSNNDSMSFQTTALSQIASLAQSDVDALNTRHSFVEIPDKTIEKEYYGSLYLLASTSRTGEAPPGLWGAWILDNPSWQGDYTLNYNYETPFYGAFTANHVELTNSYDKPVLDWLPKAQALAIQRGWTGAYYRVHIGPLPNGSADNSEHNQKSIGAWVATDILMHYYYTLDKNYAMSVYPAIKQMAVFWENYLVKDGSVYDIVNDAQQEDDPSPQTNGIMSLGLVRLLLQGAIDLSTALNLDAAERAVWQDKLTNLAPFPTFMMNGMLVFRWTSVGRDWDATNAIGIQHIYPGSQIGLDSDPTLLQTAQNMVTAMANRPGMLPRWDSGGGNVTFFPAAARVGYDPAVILSQLDTWIEGNTYPNLHIHESGGGVENLSTVVTTTDEMLLQSFMGKLRVFADWPMGTDARFGDLRAYGAFLVSSDVRSNVVQYVRIVSEAGGSFQLVNPWGNQTLHAYRNGSDAGTLSGATVSMPTSVGDVVLIAPDGPSYESIVAKLSVPLGGDN